MKIKKFLDKLQYLAPGRKIFFIYTHNNAWDRFSHGLKANTEISYWSLRALKQSFPRVCFLRVSQEKERYLRSIKESDIVIGHIGETFLRATRQTKRLIAFYPWTGHPDRFSKEKFNCIDKEEELYQLKSSQSVIFLTSEYNLKNYLQTKEKNEWKTFFAHRRLRTVHQPIDLSLFPRIKHSYHTSNFLYVGNNAHMKCLDDAKRLVARVGKRFYIYGIDKKLDNRDRVALSLLPKEADFFIQPGMWECQCVSILEAAARGFIPIVSPETGYPYDHPFLLKHGDETYNFNQIRNLLKTDSVERKAIADELHKLLLNDINHNDWNQLTDVLVDEVRRVCAT